VILLLRFLITEKMKVSNQFIDPSTSLCYAPPW